MRKYILAVMVMLIVQAHGQNDSGLTVLVGEWHSWYNQCRDTCIYPPDAVYITPIINCYNYSYHNTDYSHDTAFIYNHYEWLLQQCRQEKKYWMKKIRATDDITKEIDYRMNYDYYNGMDDLLSDMLYKQGKTQWKFKSKKVK